MSGSLTRDGGGNVPSIPGACATHNFTYLVRGEVNTTHQMLRPAEVDVTSNQRIRRARYKHTYNCSIKPLSPLKAGDVVRYRCWKVREPVVVKAETGFLRFFKILHKNGKLRRNRHHLMLTSEKLPILLNVPEPHLSNNPQPPTAAPT